jgi:hypothetical protein
LLLGNYWDDELTMQLDEIESLNYHYVFRIDTYGLLLILSGLLNKGSPFVAPPTQSPHAFGCSG